MTTKLAWGILGTGSIAKAFARGLETCQTGHLQAVASRTQEKADAFGADWKSPRCYGSYQALLEDDAVDAVYIATPHPRHPEWAVKTAEAKKHVLCEKPMALNQWQAAAMFEAARANGVLCMEAFMYRCHPQIQKLRELLREKVIGEVRLIEASFAFGGGTGPVGNPEGRIMNAELGGGGILDVGCYPVSMARMVAGEALGQRFADPRSVKGVGHLGETGVDEYAAAVLSFEGGMVAQVATGVRLSMKNDVVIYGSDGRIHIPTPWVPNGRDGIGSTQLHIHRGRETETIECTSDVTLYGLEADAVAAALPGQEVPHMTWDDTLGNLKTLDAWRKEIGLVYPHETDRPVSVNLAARPLGPRAGHNMQYAELPGLNKPVSKLIFGALTCHNSLAKAQVMFDAWVEAGGNAFDTGHVYGKTDTIFGQWLSSRNSIREDLVVIAKGMHTPDNTPARFTPQLDTMLKNLCCGYADIYIMHRDNEDVPVGEWIDLLNEEVDKGRIRIFGGSNWRVERFKEANEYAKKNGKKGFSVLNNNLALAEMIDPVWGGCLHVSDKESRAWLEETQTIHLAWSSTARGFFTDRSGPDKKDDEEIVRCWYSEENFARKARAEELARKKGCSPIQIAAAWVLHQPFPSLALVGPETPTELATILPGLDVSLTAGEVQWLVDG